MILELYNEGNAPLTEYQKNIIFGAINQVNANYEIQED